MEHGLARDAAVEQGSPTYGQLVGRIDMPNVGDELHHFGWNACSSALFRDAPGASVHGLYVFPELGRRSGGGADLARLARLVADGELDTQIHHEGSWRDAPAAIRALLDRRIAGKAVLHID